MPRLFFALWPDPAVRAGLADAAAGLDVREGRRVREENLHLTLLFLGAIEPARAARLAGWPFAPQQAGFDLEFGTSGWWRGSRVAWLAPLAVPAALEQLHAAVLGAACAAGLEAERGRFRPHVTVARAVRRAPRAHGRIALVWPVRDFVLVESHTDAAGSRYRVVCRWPLREPADA